MFYFVRVSKSAFLPQPEKNRKEFCLEAQCVQELDQVSQKIFSGLSFLFPVHHFFVSKLEEREAQNFSSNFGRALLKFSNKLNAKISRRSTAVNNLIDNLASMENCYLILIALIRLSFTCLTTLRKRQQLIVYGASNIRFRWSGGT